MERSTFWKSQELEGVELLKASFVNFEFKRHWHDELSIGVIEKGAEGIRYRGSKVTIGENQIVAINPSEIHTGYAACEQGWTYRMFYFDLNALSGHIDDFAQQHAPVINAPMLEDPDLFDLLRTLHLALEGRSLDLTKQSLLIAALRRLFALHGEQRLRCSSEALDAQSVMRVRDYLMDNWADNVILNDLVKLSGLNKFQLIRQFQQHFGVPPHQFLLLTKVAHAKQMLSSGVACVDTALACGFYDQSHLSRNFKRVIGVSPMGYTRHRFQ